MLKKGQLKRPKKRNKKTGKRENLPNSAVLPQMSNQEKGLPPNSPFDSYLFLLLSGSSFSRCSGKPAEEKEQLKRPKKRNKKTGKRENLPNSAVLPQMSNQEKRTYSEFVL
ncbi:hypothetical protein CEXT_731001 [Caerostris extrusa]|uniref:Uncharacterized protein n=1 Tax=Caerostris extrusa TaxID=172846 RepID=A0AAV4MNF7_CAEEX|nr:hypothetical protein CEXT_731001 [Caerostris extrusa]